MRNKRVLLWTGLPVVLAGAGLFSVLWLTAPPSTAITRENAAKIEKGMTLAEVEAILGGPERDESRGPLQDVASGAMLTGPWAIGESNLTVRGLSNLTNMTLQQYAEWASNTTIVGVDFHLGHASRIICFDVRPTQESVFDTLRRWFGL